MTHYAATILDPTAELRLKSDLHYRYLESAKLPEVDFKKEQIQFKFVSKVNKPLSRKVQEYIDDTHERGIHVLQSLSDLCRRTIAANFRTHPNLDGLKERDMEEVCALLPEDLPIEISASKIENEDYWRRCSMKRWKNCQLKDHGWSWKRLYLERNLWDELEGLQEASKENVALLQSIMKVSAPWVYTVKVEQMPSHLQIERLVESLPNLAYLQLTYGVKRIGMDYERSLFGLKRPDAMSIANAMKATDAVTTLDLSRNVLDDDMVRRLGTGLIRNRTITELDLSHNKIADYGVRVLAKGLLGPGSVLTSLILSSNEIHAEGGRVLGRALKENNSLQKLSLRLNRLGDEGGKMLVDCLKQNATLDSLNLGSNCLGIETAKSLALMVRSNNSLSDVDISCNALQSMGAEALRQGLETNLSITSLDIRMNNVAEDVEAAIMDIVKTPIDVREEQLREMARQAVGKSK